MEAYSGPGILFLASRFFDASRPAPEERLQREVAYQWWGETVGLKSFDDAWVSQGLAEWSAFALRESSSTGGALTGNGETNPVRSDRLCNFRVAEDGSFSDSNDDSLTLPPETTVYPGHMGVTTLGQERATNPFLQELARG